MKRILCSALSALALVAATAVPARADDLIFHDLAPCRLIDTRDGSGASTSDDTPGALANPGPHLFRLQGFCGIPNGAAAAELNFSVISPSQTGDLRAFPADGPNPVVATMSYEGGILALSNSVITPLGAVAAPTDDDLKVLIGMVGSGTIQLVIDVTGYLGPLPVIGGGDITGVTGGTGLSETPAGGASGDVTVDIEASYQLPQICGDGQVPVWIDSTDTWGCGGSIGGGGFGFAKDGMYVDETGTGNFATGTRASATAACEDANDIPLGGGCEVPPGQQPAGNDPGVEVEHFTHASYDTTATAAALTCTFFNNDSATRNANAWLACVCVPPFAPASTNCP